ncbi:hypothetical protein YK56LOC_31630 [Caballeronia sp. HLA56]
MFLDQLIKTLRIEQSDDPLASREVSGAVSDVKTESEIGAAASLHGRSLHELGYSIDQVVNDYGDLCQVVTALAQERNVPFKIEEFQCLNRCLDTAIAKAVTEFAYQQSRVATQEHKQNLKEHMGELTHELRNALGVARNAFNAARTGNLSLTGATGSMLDRGLNMMQGLIDRSLNEIKAADCSEPASLADFITEVANAAHLASQVRGVQFRVLAVDEKLAFCADRDALYAALGNLLQNAFKFTRPRSVVTLRAFSVGGRILIDVKDHCGGLPLDTQAMFEPFTQQSEDKTGLGLGLSVTKKIVETYDGVLRVKNRPGVGCVFTIDLPRYEVK